MRKRRAVVRLTKCNTVERAIKTETDTRTAAAAATAAVAQWYP